MALSEAEVLTYRETGYLVVPAVFSANEVDRINAATHRLIADASESGHDQVFEYEAGTVPVVRRVFNPFEVHPIFRQTATDHRILDRVESLVGPDIALQHSKLNMKAARLGGAVQWHQDLTYFPHTNDDLVAVMIHLDNATIENGCIEVLPNNHHRFFDHSLPDGSFAGMVTESIDPSETTRVKCAAGSVIFLHPLTPHRSSTNVSGKSRRLLIFEYRAADAFPIYNGDQIVGCEAFAHHLRGSPARHARFGGPPPAIYRPRGDPKSIFQLQEASAALLDHGGVDQAVESRAALVAY